VIDQLPKIPDDNTYQPVEVNKKTQEKVTLNDLPPPGALLQRPITEREILALKAFGSDTLNLLNEISKDMLPGIGEARAVEYTNQEIAALKNAVEERDVPGTIVHGIGVPVMSAGTLPYWLGGGVIGGAAAFLMRDIIGKGYRNMTSKFRMQEPARGASPRTDIPEEVLEQPGQKVANQRADIVVKQKDVPVKITEKFNFGETGTPVRTKYSKSTSDFLGSRSFDVIAKENFTGMNNDQITNRVINLIRTGKVNREEIFDAGILKLDESFKPIGGALASIPKEIGGTISKQDILKMLKNAPSQRLKINRYGSRDFDSDFFDLYASTDIMNANLKGSLNEKIFQTTNTADRAAFRNVEQILTDLQKSYDKTASNRTVVANFASDRKLNPLRDIIPSLSVGDQQIMRSFISNIEKMRKYVSPSKGEFSGPAKHSTSTTTGGDNYYETVISLDEAIPGNKSKGKFVESGHFPDVNPVVHYRAKTRYNQKGEPIIAIDEIQSDTLQPFYGGSKSADIRKAMNNPYGKSLVESIIKKRLLTLVDEQKPILAKLRKQSLTSAEMKKLNDLDAEQALYKKYFQKSELMTDESMQKLYKAVGDATKKSPDYYPYLKSYYELALRSAVNDAIVKGKRGITVVPVSKNTHHSKDKGHYLYYGDEKGSKLKALEQGALPAPGKKSSPDAIYPATLKKIAKQFKQDYGIDLVVRKQKVFNTSMPKDGSYAIRNPNGTIMATFKKKANRDYVLNKLNSNRSTSDRLAADLLGGEDIKVEEAFSGIVLEIPENAAKLLKKKKMRSYKTGGLVAFEPKREYFASIF
tara:strand:+ start:637 stop:3069 length:2433 start_codon:yes stop_codon:yes gene_type:complete